MASSTSQKFRDFTGEPLKDKELHEVPGLGPKLASHLETAGITKVHIRSEEWFSWGADGYVFFLRHSNCWAFIWRCWRTRNTSSCGSETTPVPIDIKRKNVPMLSMPFVLNFFELSHLLLLSMLYIIQVKRSSSFFKHRTSSSCWCRRWMMFTLFLGTSAVLRSMFGMFLALLCSYS